ncbi:MAG: hypothetical protein ACPGWR_21445 [Ardenticatenaceae bacterium]
MGTDLSAIANTDELSTDYGNGFNGLWDGNGSLSTDYGNGFNGWERIAVNGLWERI